MPLAESALRALRAVARWRPPPRLGPLAREPWAVLAPLLLLQWAALLAFALTVRHNGWLYYQGGDETFYYTTAWLLSGWTLPTTPIGFGWSYLLSPIGAIVGPNTLAALPPILILNTVVLMPVALLCMYGIGARIGGRALGYWSALLWIVVPYLAIPLWDHRYHEKYTEVTLSQTLGLSALADFPSMVCLLLAAYLTIRALDTDDRWAAVAAGLATGFAVGIKPANGLFVIAPLLAFAISRRRGQLLAFVPACVPALVALAVWKERGLGNTPALSLGGRHLATVGGADVTPLALSNPLHRYVHLDFGQLHANLVQLGEFFWSVRPLEFIPFAGAIAIWRRSAAQAWLVFGWFAAFLIVKGTSANAKVEDATFFRLLMPSFPAFVLLLALLPLLLPRVGPALAERLPSARPRPTSLAAVGVAALVFAAIPLLVAATSRKQQGASAVKFFEQGVFVPLDDSFAPTVRAAGARRVISWSPPRSPGVHAFYRVLRVPVEAENPENQSFGPLVDGVYCQQGKGSDGAADCRLFMDTIAVTRGTSYVDTPPRGKWSYRIGLVANWANDTSRGDIVLFSKAARTTAA